MDQNIEDGFSICDECLGSDKQIKMTKHTNAAECKLCTRPFTVFRWNNKTASRRTGKTTICYTCARTKNCCQSCMLDINYHIPIEIRDTALRMAGLDSSKGLLTASKVNQETKALMADKNEQTLRNSDLVGEDDVNQEKAREILYKLADKLKNATKTAPKNPKTTNTEESAKLSKDISKLISKLPFGGNINPDTNPTLTSFFLFGFNSDLPIYAVTNYATKFGKVKSLTILHNAKCGYLTFTTRQAAENFASDINSNGLNTNKSTAGLVVLEGKYPIRVSWGKVQPLGTSNDEHHKLSLVVNKVLKQLSEKDTRTESKPKQSSKVTTPKSKNKSKKPLEIKSAPTKYKAIRSDYEL
ncbi:Pre-mRNA-splicing factor SLT11 [Scheffersomyces coipomensis]|uniref:Pre-mRNA-splicing factor SLT11 n=1 Tax=Scheffersomyces coipomensis TaxID=1788519 RepID=UPI00315DA8E3